VAPSGKIALTADSGDAGGSDGSVACRSRRLAFWLRKWISDNRVLRLGFWQSFVHFPMDRNLKSSE